MNLVKYARDNKNQIVGAVVAIAKNQVGWSLCNKRDRIFGINKDLALSIAIERAFKHTKSVNVPKSLIDSYNKMMVRSTKYYK